MAICWKLSVVSIVVVSLFPSSQSASVPIVDRGVFVITGVESCRNRLGYCVLGVDCSTDPEFIDDDLGGHCIGLRNAFTPPVYFSCCRFNPLPDSSVTFRPRPGATPHTLPPTLSPTTPLPSSTDNPELYHSSTHLILNNSIIGDSIEKKESTHHSHEDYSEESLAHKNDFSVSNSSAVPETVITSHESSQEKDKDNESSDTNTSNNKDSSSEGNDKSDVDNEKSAEGNEKSAEENEKSTEESENSVEGKEKSAEDSEKSTEDSEKSTEDKSTGGKLKKRPVSQGSDEISVESGGKSSDEGSRKSSEDESKDSSESASLHDVEEDEVNNHSPGSGAYRHSAETAQTQGEDSNEQHSDELIYHIFHLPEKKRPAPVSSYSAGDLGALQDLESAEEEKKNATHNSTNTGNNTIVIIEESTATETNFKEQITVQLGSLQIVLSEGIFEKLGQENLATHSFPNLPMEPTPNKTINSTVTTESTPEDNDLSESSENLKLSFYFGTGNDSLVQEWKTETLGSSESRISEVPAHESTIAPAFSTTNIQTTLSSTNSQPTLNSTNNEPTSNATSTESVVVTTITESVSYDQAHTEETEDSSKHYEPATTAMIEEDENEMISTPASEYEERLDIDGAIVELDPGFSSDTTTGQIPIDNTESWTVEDNTEGIKHDASLLDDIFIETTADPIESTLLPTSCGKRGHIFGGNVLPFDDQNNQISSTSIWCWIAAFVEIEDKNKETFSTKGSSSFLCAGALLERDLVVTTASCIERLFSKGLDRVGVVLGNSNLRLKIPQAVQYQFAKQAVVHEDYQISATIHRNDIGLVQLESPVNLSPTVCLVCLPSEESEFSNSSCTVVGYAHPQADEVDDRDSSEVSLAGILHEADQKVLETNNCGKGLLRYVINKTIAQSSAESFLCAHGLPATETCFVPDDRGSPMSCVEDNVYRLAGLFSFGFHCSQPNRPSVYVDVRKHIRWIKTNYLRMLGYLV